MKTNLKKLTIYGLISVLLNYNQLANAETASITTASQLPIEFQSAEGRFSEAIPMWEAHVKGSHEWTKHLSIELDRIGTNIIDVIPSDGSTFCPNYKNLSIQNRKDFWIYLISVMTKFESNFNPNSTYKENFKDRNGQYVISRGLLQISIESGNSYDCQLKNAKELHNPLINLSCGIRILDRWLAHDGRIAGKVNSKWQGGARYWSVLRAGNKESYRTIVQSTHNLKICQLHTSLPD